MTEQSGKRVSGTTAGKKFAHLLERVEAYYRAKILEHGSVPSGVDWNSKESQELRFVQLLMVCDGTGHFSINDLGCGYGQLYDYMKKRFTEFVYHGFDVSEAMIESALERHGGNSGATFRVAHQADARADYIVASGIFNVKLDATDAEWLTYILDTLSGMDEASEKGFAFNCLSRYSDPELMRVDLYYADPCFLFDHCKRIFSRHVALLHDYGLYEFTILVRKRI